MNMIRRNFLKLFGGLTALVATLKFDRVKAVPIFKEGDLRPSWCPEGFLPLQGQLITKGQYPDLFFKSVIAGKNFIPKFSGKEAANLSKVIPYMPTELEKAGWQDTLTRTIPKTKDIVQVALISVQHLRWPNGRPIRAGFVTYVPVEKNLFESTYGVISETSKITMSYSGYNDITNMVRA